MRPMIKHAFILLLTIAAASPLTAVAQSSAAASTGKQPREELALGYSYVRSNAPPGASSSFNMNGGNSTFAWSLKPGRFALVGDVAVVHAGKVSTSNYGLTLSTYTAGARYSPRLGHSPLHPYGQVLLGLAHASGTLVEGSNPGAANASASFAANFGGGLDLRATTRFSVRLVEVSYLLTTLDNGSNNHQNNLRIGAGLVIRFGAR